MKLKMRYLFEGKWYYIDFVKDNLAIKFKEYEYIGKTTRLQLWTNLLDKNKKEIFEGDIVEIIHSCWTEDTEVKFVEGCFIFEQLKKHPKNDGKVLVTGRDILRSTWKLEVIGNIYENKELVDYETKS